MTIRILLISDIHGNYPALKAIDHQLDTASFDYIVNSGDSLVYAPFPNETLAWLAEHQALSILGNTDKKTIKFLLGKTVKKPHNPEKRIMYTETAEQLDSAGRRYLLALRKKRKLQLLFSGRGSKKGKKTLGIFHGSPADHNEFLFADTADARFQELAKTAQCDIVVTGHSHSPYHKTIAGVHFINPGSAGRMFDGDPRASCATLELSADAVTVRHYRVAYAIDEVVARIREKDLPEIYATMYRQGKKLN